MVVRIRATDPNTGNKQFLSLTSVAEAAALCAALKDVTQKGKWEAVFGNILVYCVEES